MAECGVPGWMWCDVFQFWVFEVNEQHKIDIKRLKIWKYHLLKTMLCSYACVVLFFFCCFVLDVWFYLSVHGQLMASPLVKQFLSRHHKLWKLQGGWYFLHDVPWHSSPPPNSAAQKILNDAKCVWWLPLHDLGLLFLLLLAADNATNCISLAG